MRRFYCMETNTETNEKSPGLYMATFRKEDLYPLWDRCSSITNANLRARMVANLFSAAAACKILFQLGVQADTSIAMQEIPSILSKWDISEVYVNDCRISVRYSFGDYKYFVPKKHERYGLFGDLFMFVRISEDLKLAKLEGFLPCKNINKSNSDSENYYVHSDDLKSLEEIKKYLNIKKPEENIEEVKKWRKHIIEYLEGRLDNKIKFFKRLAVSMFLRQDMIKIENSEYIFNQLADKEDIIRQEIDKDIENIERLAAAFEQSRENILSASESQNFKIECARSNLEKLFNASPSRNVELENIHNKTTEEVMDTLLTPSATAIQKDTLPMTAVLRAFRVFGALILLFLIVGAIFCINDYPRYTTDTSYSVMNSHKVTVVRKKISKIKNKLFKFVGLSDK